MPKDKLYQTGSKKQQNKRPPRVSRNEEDALKNNQNQVNKDVKNAEEEEENEDEDYDE